MVVSVSVLTVPLFLAFTIKIKDTEKIVAVAANFQFLAILIF
jgi:hypothetical protein